LLSGQRDSSNPKPTSPPPSDGMGLKRGGATALDLYINEVDASHNLDRWGATELCGGKPLQAYRGWLPLKPRRGERSFLVHRGPQPLIRRQGGGGPLGG